MQFFGPKLCEANKRELKKWKDLDQFIKDVKKGKMTFSPMLNGLMRSAIIEWQPKKIGKRLNVVKSKAKHLLCKC